MCDGVFCTRAEQHTREAARCVLLLDMLAPWVSLLFASYVSYTPDTLNLAALKLRIYLVAREEPYVRPRLESLFSLLNIRLESP